jgi:hypothetical protein
MQIVVLAEQIHIPSKSLFQWGQAAAPSMMGTVQCNQTANLHSYWSLQVMMVPEKICRSFGKPVTNIFFFSHEHRELSKRPHWQLRKRRLCDRSIWATCSWNLLHDFHDLLKLDLTSTTSTWWRVLLYFPSFIFWWSDNIYIIYISCWVLQMAWQIDNHNLAFSPY